MDTHGEECRPLLARVCNSMCNVVHRQMVLGAVVGPIVGAFVPVVLELVLSWHWSKFNCMSIILISFAMIVSLLTPTAVELSVWMGFISTCSLAVRKRAASSASAAEAMTNLIICVMVRMAPLN